MDLSGSENLLQATGRHKFATVLVDPAWQFQNRTGKMAPEHKRLSRYPTMSLREIKDLPMRAISEDTAHLSCGFLMRFWLKEYRLESWGVYL